MSEKLTCPECGCLCKKCITSLRTWPENGELKTGVDILHLHQEIESLKRQLMEREYHILKMETSVLDHAEQYPNGEWGYLQQELEIWKTKFERLFEGHKKIQKVNQGLEDKLLKLVDKFETEKSALNRDVAELTNRLVDSRLSVTDLEEQIEQYRNDCSIAIRLLQCKPSNFISQKLSSFPSDVQDRVNSHFAPRSKDLHNSQSTPEFRTIRVPVPTFPQSAMVYSVDHMHVINVPRPEQPETDYVSAAIMAKVIEERTKERAEKNGHCKACWHRRHTLDHRDCATQTAEESVPLIGTGPVQVNGSVNGLTNEVSVAAVNGGVANGIVPVHVNKKEVISSIGLGCSRFRNGSSMSTETVI